MEQLPVSKDLDKTSPVPSANSSVEYLDGSAGADVSPVGIGNTFDHSGLINTSVQVTGP